MIVGSHPSHSRCNHRLLGGGGARAGQPPKAWQRWAGASANPTPGLMGRLDHLSISEANPRSLECFSKICSFSFS